MSYTSYKDLIVWQKAMDLTDETYKLVKKLPKDVLYALSAQMRRAAVSVPSNIAEGHGRQSKREFAQYLSVANGSLMELETQIMICERQGYLSSGDVNTALSISNEINRMLSALIINLNGQDT